MLTIHLTREHATDILQAVEDGIVSLRRDVRELRRPHHREPEDVQLADHLSSIADKEQEALDALRAQINR